MIEAVSTEGGADLNRRRALAGVDEAGLGPILGPLVVAGAVLEGPPGGDPWRLLRRLVCRNRSETGKIRVADSKKVHQGVQKLAHIERTALAFWGALAGDIPATVRDLLGAADVDVAHLARCPWYGALDARLPLECDRDELRLLAHRLGRELERTSIRLLRLTFRVLDVEEFNALIAATNNKAEAHFGAYTEILADLLAAVPAAGGQVVADRCGGRFHYGRALSRRWPDAKIAVLSESPERSEYVVDRGGMKTKVTFAERAEEQAFPTALASCLAKYVRETMIHSLNAWFVARRPDLRPTAGYYTDGKRFLAEIEGMPDVPWERLVRCR
ncbi:MAG: hypothetical protein IPM13_19355 [Phycisphaerales bacterium]|nr:hypothetical protein [Phycisphaerales bacterium]